MAKNPYLKLDDACHAAGISGWIKFDHTFNGEDYTVIIGRKPERGDDGFYRQPDSTLS